jgi:hypothetical protein
MSSPGPHDSERNKFFRLVHLLFEELPRILRGKFKALWASHFETVWQDDKNFGDNFKQLDKNRKDAKLPPVIHKLLDSGNTASWDATCLFYALLRSQLNLTSHDADSKQKIQTLNKFRNLVAHANSCLIEPGKFDPCCKTADDVLDLTVKICLEIDTDHSIPSQDRLRKLSLNVLDENTVITLESKYQDEFEQMRKQISMVEDVLSTLSERVKELEKWKDTASPTHLSEQTTEGYSATDFSAVLQTSTLGTSEPYCCLKWRSSLEGQIEDMHTDVLRENGNFDISAGVSFGRNSERAAANYSFNGDFVRSWSSGTHFKIQYRKDTGTWWMVLERSSGDSYPAFCGAFVKVSEKVALRVNDFIKVGDGFSSSRDLANSSFFVQWQ